VDRPGKGREKGKKRRFPACGLSRMSEYKRGQIVKAKKPALIGD
jgi:hypothetical protein